MSEENKGESTKTGDDATAAAARAEETSSALDMTALEGRIRALEQGAQYDGIRDAVHKVETEFLLKMREIRAAITESTASGGGGVEGIAAASEARKEVEALREENAALRKANSKLEYRVRHLLTYLEDLFEANKNVKPPEVVVAPVEKGDAGTQTEAEKPKETADKENQASPQDFGVQEVFVNAVQQQEQDKTLDLMLEMQAQKQQQQAQQQEQQQQQQASAAAQQAMMHQSVPIPRTTTTTTTPPRKQKQQQQQGANMAKGNDSDGSVASF